MGTQVQKLISPKKRYDLSLRIFILIKSINLLFKIQYRKLSGLHLKQIFNYAHNVLIGHKNKECNKQNNERDNKPFHGFGFHSFLGYGF